MILEDGAVLEGSCSMLKAKETQESRAAEVESHYRTNEYSAAAQTEDEDETETLFDSSEEEIEDEAEETAGAATI